MLQRIVDPSGFFTNDFEVIAEAWTDAFGNYGFTNLFEGDQFIVAVDSNTGDLVGDGTILAQQTFSSEGGITESFSTNNFSSVTQEDGFLIGGANSAISNSFSAAVGLSLIHI